MSARLLALWLVTIPAFAGGPDYNAFSDAQGHIGTPEQVAAAQDMVRAPGQLEVVFADAAKENRRAAQAFQELETRFFPDIGREVAERSGTLKCRMPVVKELATQDCQPDWRGLDFLPKTEAGARLRQAAIDAYRVRAKQLGIEHAAIIATINAALAVGGAGMVVYSAEARAAATEAVRTVPAARGAAEAVKVGEYMLTRTVAGKLAERPYLNSPLTLREIMTAGKPIPDPGGVTGALRWDVPGEFRGSAGIWELVIDPQSKTVLHWLFKAAP